MMTPTDWVELAKALAWPVTVLILVSAFHKVIKDTFMTRLKGVKLGPGEIEFMPPASSESGEIMGVNKTESLTSVEWNRSGALFWFVNDSTTAFASARQYRDRLGFYDYINRTLNHARQLNLDEAILNELKRLRDEALAKRDEEWLPNEREEVSNSISRIYNTVAAIAEDHENKVCNPPFKANPD